MSRGGRGGRGGASKTLNREQLTALGITSNEILPGIVTQPPPLYPLLEKRPVPVQASWDNLLRIQQDFIDHMQLSASYLKMPEGKKTQAEQEIDKLVAQLPNAKEKFDWRLFPSELRPKMLAKRGQKVSKKEVNIDQRLNMLEKMEEKSSKLDSSVKVEMEGEIEEEGGGFEEEDEEMDDGTDYANNYFDNGEDYEEEDDNLDDGPIY